MAAGSGKAVFLDRDGTLIRDCVYLSDPNKVEPLPGAAEALRLLRQAGYLLFLFTNQSGIGRGYFTQEEADACNRETEKRLGLSPGFDGICVAPETPEEEPVYRKPSPKYILEMIEAHRLDSQRVWMLGDKKSDVEAGLRAGVSGIRIGERDADKRPEVPTFASVFRFTEWLLRQPFEKRDKQFFGE